VRNWSIEWGWKASISLPCIWGILIHFLLKLAVFLSINLLFEEFHLLPDKGSQWTPYMIHVSPTNVIYGYGRETIITVQFSFSILVFSALLNWIMRPLSTYYNKMIFSLSISWVYLLACIFWPHSWNHASESHHLNWSKAATLFVLVLWPVHLYPQSVTPVLVSGYRLLRQSLLCLLVVTYYCVRLKITNTKSKHVYLVCSS
jgi:hypothetical protein